MNVVHWFCQTCGLVYVETGETGMETEGAALRAIHPNRARCPRCGGDRREKVGAASGIRGA